jgi:Na+-transporting methylmalonyl-CoA/oxaloacetate decarboxylase beta subunit
VKLKTVPNRSKRRFAFGVLEQLSTIFGAITASVLTIGLFLPVLNAISGQAMLSRDTLVAIARLVLAFTCGTALAAVILRGFARLLEDDGKRTGEK